MLCLLAAFFPYEMFQELGLIRNTVFMLPSGGLLGQTPHTALVFRDDTKAWSWSWCAGATEPCSHLRTGWHSPLDDARPRPGWSCAVRSTRRHLTSHALGGFRLSKTSNTGGFLYITRKQINQLKEN